MLNMSCFMFFNLIKESTLCLLQVVTGCDSSSITMWDIETGNKSIVFVTGSNWL